MILYLRYKILRQGLKFNERFENGCFMNEIWSWEDLRLFIGVARAGGLAGAVETTHASAPTLSRRMHCLERAMGTTLFIRTRDGYELTSAGSELLGLAETLQNGALRIDRWKSNADTLPVVKIAAGAWTASFIARHLAGLVNPDTPVRIEIATGVSQADLLRRQANLGLRNRRPEAQGLAGQRLVRVEFAMYGSLPFIRDHRIAIDHGRMQECTWIALAPAGPKPPSAVWLDDYLHKEPDITCSSAQAMLEAALGGAGLCVLPCFIGDTENRLARASPVIESLGHDQWLVSHDDDRHQKQIATVQRALATLIRGHRSLFAGLLATRPGAPQ